MKQERGSGLVSWSTRDILLAAVLASVFGVLYQAWNYLYVPLETISPILGDATMYGFWFIAGILVPYIIRRPGAALLGEFLAGLVSMLLGGLGALPELDPPPELSASGTAVAAASGAGGGTASCK